MLNDPTPAKIRDIAWIFAVYFAVAWLLLLGVIVRPQHVSRAMLAAIVVVGVVTQAPTAIFLETKLHAGTSSLLDIFTIGVPEELAKAIPIVVVAWIWRRYWHTQTPRDYLFLGAVSGLVFGAAEVVHYFTDVLGSISGHATGLDLQTVTIQYIWRFLTDPIDPPAGRDHRLLHRAGHRRPGPELDRPGRDRHRGLQPQRLEPDQQPPRLGAGAGQRALPRLRPGRGLAARSRRWPRRTAAHAGPAGHAGPARAARGPGCAAPRARSAAPGLAGAPGRAR
jgi:hypothetical protein